MKILECSSKGDKRYSAFYAKVNFYGFEDTIENIYQKSKVFLLNNKTIHLDTKEAKGKKPVGFTINNIIYDLKYLSQFYYLLWLTYLDNNKDLVEYAKQFDDFNNMFKNKNTKYCQVDVIKMYIKEGRNKVIDFCTPLTNKIQQYNKTKSSYYVIVAGGRKFNRYKLLKTKLDYYLQNKMKTHIIVIVSGHATGADTLGEKYAKERNLKVKLFPAKWNDLDVQPCLVKTNSKDIKYNALAGFNRNKEMRDIANCLVAFWNGRSKGTKNMIKLCKEAHIPLRVVKY